MSSKTNVNNPDSPWHQGDTASYNHVRDNKTAKESSSSDSLSNNGMFSNERRNKATTIGDSWQAANALLTHDQSSAGTVPTSQLSNSNSCWQTAAPPASLSRGDSPDLPPPPPSQDDFVSDDSCPLPPPPSSDSFLQLPPPEVSSRHDLQPPQSLPYTAPPTALSHPFSMGRHHEALYQNQQEAFTSLQLPASLAAGGLSLKDDLGSGERMR